jgi:hypothetical protein
MRQLLLFDKNEIEECAGAGFTPRAKGGMREHTLRMREIVRANSEHADKFSETFRRCGHVSPKQVVK